MKTARFFSSIIAAALLVGCAASDNSSLSVEVSDAATGAPVANAKVVADTPSHDHPFSIATMLGLTGPEFSTAFTDDHGRAVVEYATGRPVRIGVLARGYPLLIRIIDRPWLGEEELLGDTDSATSSRLRARVAPAGP